MQSKKVVKSREHVHLRALSIRKEVPPLHKELKQKVVDKQPFFSPLYGLGMRLTVSACTFAMQLSYSCHRAHSALRGTQCPCNVVNTVPLTQLSITSMDRPTAGLIHYDMITH